MWAITCSVRYVFIIPCSSGVGYSRFRWVTILITLFEIMNTFCWNVFMNAGKRFRITWFFVFSIIIFAVCLCMFTCKILLWVNLMVCTDFLTQHNIPWQLLIQNKVLYLRSTNSGSWTKYSYWELGRTLSLSWISQKYEFEEGPGLHIWKLALSWNVSHKQ